MSEEKCPKCGGEMVDQCHRKEADMGSSLLVDGIVAEELCLCRQLFAAIAAKEKAEAQAINQAALIDEAVHAVNVALPEQADPVKPGNLCEHISKIAVQRNDALARAEKAEAACAEMRSGVAECRDKFGPHSLAALAKLNELVMFNNPGQSILDELTRLREIVGKLRKTDNGVPMVPGGHYWAYVCDRYDNTENWELHEVVWWQGGGDDCFNPEFTMVPPDDMRWEFFNVDGVYSSRAAAEAAMKGEGK